MEKPFKEAALDVALKVTKKSLRSARGLGVPTEAIGKVCVCEDEDGKAWVKQVKVGREDGTFSLLSINPETENMHAGEG